GSGVWMAGGGSAWLEGSIVAGNFSAAGASDLLGSFTLTYSLVQTPDAGTILAGSTGYLVGEDPLLGPLGDHGGGTRTMLPAIGSPAIDAGGACLVSPLFIDQRYFSHCVNRLLDMGSVEPQSPPDLILPH